jgi:MOSC domain-containing protein YiiM
MTCALSETGYASYNAKEYYVTKLIATVVSVHAGSNDDMSKEEQSSIEVELDGITGDAHRSYSRKAWAGDKQPEGTVRRNERQWSAVSVEELAEIQESMDLTESPTPTELGANLCLSGVSQLSRLPKGTVLRFPSGAELIVEEYNPPCHDMGKKLAGLHTTRSGEPLSSTAFSKAAKLNRGLVGVVDVTGVINAGDEVQIELYETPSWLIRSDD